MQSYIFYQVTAKNDGWKTPALPILSVDGEVERGLKAQ